MADGEVIAVAADDQHRFSKKQTTEIRVLTGLGVEGDAHLGLTVKHRSRVAVDPSQPNLRQVHLIHAELFDELREKGFTVGPADLGENVTTRGLDLLALPRGAVLKLGTDVELEVTGLRNPCSQIDKFQPGLLKAVLDKRANGKIILRAGIMTVVLKGGIVRTGEAITVVLPPPPFFPLERV
ncbi:MOSC domain-containing protein [Rhizobium mongolense]|jgi:MOSC domain-containing protein YiiM|uniref:MOSC domain-containing protein n=1 Tax=Rhizobium mongolense TaxID=57676 RepID=UPI0034A4DC2E